MIITFNINYYTVEGESVCIKSDNPAFKCGLVMNQTGHESHTVSVELPDNPVSLTYRYFISRADGSDRQEWGEERHIECDADTVVYDCWRDRPDDSPYYTSAFTEVINRRDNASRKDPVVARGSLTFKVSAPMVAPGHSLAVIGASDTLGNWDTTRAVAMNDARFPEWTVSLDRGKLPEAFEYKFIIIETATKRLVEWESGFNRIYRTPAHIGNDTAVVIDCDEYKSSADRWRGAGVAIPVFSLRSENDFGVGDFLDLRLMVDWAVATGMKIIQILPVNDTTMTHGWMDSYPYNAISTTALHPIYLRPSAIAGLNDAAREKFYADEARRLNMDTTVDYVEASRLKLAHSRELFAQEGPATIASHDFNAFVRDNSDWLKPYAAFCLLRDMHSTADYKSWGKYSVYDANEIDSLIDSHLEEINFIYWQQYWLHRQLSEVREYACTHGVALKGDIPIGISTSSVEAWTAPTLFNLDESAGAPPDDFAVNGQNWGFPTYRWDVMVRDNYAWWRSRFSRMARYFDAYRIDHILGFFRIWEIPVDAVHGLLGHFNPALPMSVEELHDSYGFDIDPNLHATPYITRELIATLAPELVDDIVNGYLEPIDDTGRYRLLPDYATQRQIADHVRTLDPTPRAQQLAECMMSLPDQVLFIPDPVKADHYHPRIEGRNTSAYRALSEADRQRFDRLHDDFYYRRHNDFWEANAMHRLPPLLDSTSMLVCGEDLGMIPACVPQVMDRLRILSLEIQRMPKQYGVTFGDTSRYPYLSVATTSTHDMPGIRQWWNENPDLARKYYSEVLHRPADETPSEATPEMCREIVSLHLASPSMLCILPLADWLSVDGDIRRPDPTEELINIPACPRHYWRYRMHLTLERLLEETSLNHELKGLIQTFRAS